MSRATVRQTAAAPAGNPLSSTGRPHRLVAKSIGSSAAVRIEGSGVIGRVHSVFGGAIDVTATTGSMFSIVREDSGAGPVNIVTNFSVGKRMTEMEVESGQEVERRGEELVVGGGRLLISLQGAKVFPRGQERFRDQTERCDCRQNGRKTGEPSGAGRSDRTAVTGAAQEVEPVLSTRPAEGAFSP